MNNTAIKLILKNLEGQQLTAFDVGAKGGVLLFPKLEEFFNFYGFEPNIEEFNQLKNKNNITYFPFAFGKNSGIKNFNITKDASYSSFLKVDNSNFKKHFGLMKDYPNLLNLPRIKRTLLKRKMSGKL
jgi:hypothetical protein